VQLFKLMKKQSGFLS